MIVSVNAGQQTKLDRDVSAAIFLKKNPGWKPEDLGYPPADYILIDMMWLLA